MSRSSSPLLLVAALGLGVVLGIAFDRSGPHVSAQSAPPARPELAVAPTTPAPRASTEEALYQQLDRQYEQFQHINRTFELVSKAVSPAVVHIVAQKTSRGDDGFRVRHFEETGSGVIVRGEKGRELYVLTNNHVIDGARPEKVNIFLQNGASIHPERILLDAKADIAVLTLKRTDLPAARIGDSDEVSVGTWVLALGSPFGLTHSVSQGIISARGRHMEELQDVENQDFLQTDAAINPGNSGGPLVNMKGEVIGINNSIASNGGGNEGVGFSIPINLARWIMNQLLVHGKVARGALGIDLHPEFRSEDARTLGLDRPRGAWIDVVHPASPAATAGMRDNDVILKFKGIDIHDLNHLINLVSMAPIGQPAEVVIWRGGESKTMSVVVGERDRTVATTAPGERPPAGRGLLHRPSRPGLTPSFAKGLELTTLDEAAALKLGMPAGTVGAVVAKVEPTSPFAGILKPNDLLVRIDNHAVASAEAAARALNRVPASGHLTVEFDRVVKGTIERRSVPMP